jgi:hypothetical protein
MRTIVLLPDYNSYKVRHIAVFIRKAETVLEFDVAVYPMERDQILFAKQYLVGNAAAAWERFCSQHKESNHTLAAMKELLHSWVALSKD